MSESRPVTVEAVMHCFGLRRGQRATVEETPAVTTAINDGKLLRITPADSAAVADSATWAECPNCFVESTDVENGARGLAEGAYLPVCPSCGVDDVPEMVTTDTCRNPER